MNEARNELCHSLSNLYLAERPCVAFFLQFAANASFILFWQSNLPASEDLLETSQGSSGGEKVNTRPVERPQRIGITKFWHFYTS